MEMYASNIGNMSSYSECILEKMCRRISEMQIVQTVNGRYFPASIFVYFIKIVNFLPVWYFGPVR
ncbi:MAG: hypothetical protein ACRCUY_08075 [Thermoguttaceae bacterium]